MIEALDREQRGIVEGPITTQPEVFTEEDILFLEGLATIDEAYTSETEDELTLIPGDKVTGGTDPGNLDCHWQ